MKRIKVTKIDTSSREYLRFLAQYARKRGYDTPIHQIPHDILTELSACALMCFTARHERIGTEFEIEIVGKVFRCQKDGKYSLIFDKDNFAEQMQFDKDDPIFETLNNPVNRYVLRKSEMFRHPLMTVTEAEVNGEIQDVVNGYGVATMLINGLRGNMETVDGGKKAEESFSRFVLESGRMANIQVLLAKIKAGELMAIMEASNLINDGFERIVARAFGQDI